MTLFTPATLRRALAQAGFEQIVCSYSAGSYLAALHSIHLDGKRALVVDLGGGSLELALGAGTRPDRIDRSSPASSR